jgi:hypothetical protein
MRTAFEHEGDIRSVDILAALVALWREGASGSLQFSRPGATAGFEIAGGELLASSSSDPRFETAAILVRAGKLDARTLERLAAPEGADRALLALQAGVLTRREWRWGEKIRGVEILSDLLTWLEGQYWFLRKNGDEPDGGEARLPIPRLILELFLRSRDRSLVVKHLGGADVPLQRAAHFDAEFSTFGLTADAESVVRLIDGRATAEEIAREAPAEVFAVEKLLAALVTLGLIHPEFAGEASTSTRALAILPPRGDPEADAGTGRETEAIASGFAAGSSTTPELASAPPEAEGEEEAVDAEFRGAEEPEEIVDEEEVVEEEAAETEEIAAGPTELDSEPDWRDRREEPAVERPGMEPDLEAVRLGMAGPSAEESEVPELDAGIGRAEPGPDEPLAPETGIASPERPERRPVSPLLWVLAALILTVGIVLLVRSRSGSPAGKTTEPGAAATPASGPPEMGLAAVPSPAAPPAEATAAPVATAAMPTAAPAAAPTAIPVAPPTAIPKSHPAPAAPAKAAPAAPAAGRENRQYWTDRAARDAQRLAGDRKTRYAVQLELACEVPSLVEAFQHDRGGNMWVLSTPHQGRTCFRVLWGRYPTIEAAKRGAGGAPRFFSTPKNKPAVTAVR